MNKKILSALFFGMLIAATPAQSELKILAVGDSITEGYTPSPGTGTPSFRKDFISLLSQHACSFNMVGSRKDNRPATSFNQSSLPERGDQDTDHEGYSGQSAEHFLITPNDPPYRGNPGISATVATYDPDIVLLHIGSNDMFGGQDVTDTVGEIDQIVANIIAENSAIKIFVANVIPWFGTSPRNSNISADIAQLGDEIEAAIENTNSPYTNLRHANVTLVDVRNAIPGTRAAYSQSLMQADLVHPNAAGEAYIAESFYVEVLASGVCNSFSADTVAPITNTNSVAILSDVTVSFDGSATDVGGSGFDRIDIAIEDPTAANDNVRWWNFTIGGFGPIVVNRKAVGITTATKINPSTGSTDWTINVDNLPAGDVRLYALSYDNMGLNAYSGIKTWPVNQLFTIDYSEVEYCNGLAVTVNLQTGFGSPTSGNDVILGTENADTINAFGGNDTICSLGGNDTIASGNGDDWIDAGSGDDEVLAGGNDDTIFGGSGDDDLSGGPGADYLYGEEDDDFLRGNSGNDTIEGAAGVDKIWGGPGNDNIFTGSGATVGSGVIVDGGAGNDTITGGADADEIRGSTDDDVINGGGGNDRLFGGGGVDTIKGQAGDDFIRGNAANDELSGGSGRDNIDGGTGHDIVFGGADNDELFGATGNDEIHGESGDDYIIGGGGNDNLFGGSGADTILGGGSIDNLDGGGGATDTCDGQSGPDIATSSCEVVLNMP